MGAEPDLGKQEELMETIRFLSSSYTPEWRLNLLKPDMGTALACIFVRVMEESMEDYGHVPEFLYREFMYEAGCMPKTASPSRGYMTFGLVKPDMPELLLPKGWGVVSQGEAGSVNMKTEEDVYVSSASVSLTAGKNTQGGGEWLLAFDRPVTRGVISLLLVMKGRGRASGGHFLWEYYGKHGWTPLAVKDGTGGLVHSGIVSFAATSDFVPMEVCGQQRWAVRVYAGEDEEMTGHTSAGEAGSLPGCLPDLYMNASPVIAVEPGQKGNLRPGTRHRMKKTAGFVSSIQNPEYFFGGGDEESWGEAALRTSARLRHQFRAVTPGDYERLAKECCEDILRARCFPGYDGAGNKMWGAVAVVVLLKNFLEGQSYFYKVKEELELYFKERACGCLAAGQGFAVASPRFIRMDVKTVLCVRDQSMVMEVLEDAKRELGRFLDPVTGGYDGNGWDMGILPDHLQLKNCLQHVEGVFYVKQLTCLCLEEKDGGWKESEWENVSLFPWSLPVPGTCAVDVEVG